MLKPPKNSEESKYAIGKDSLKIIIKVQTKIQDSLFESNFICKVATSVRKKERQVNNQMLKALIDSGARE